MPRGPAVSITGIELRREGNYAVVYVEKDGKSYEAIREIYDNNFGHHVTEYGLAKLSKLDWLQPESKKEELPAVSDASHRS